MGKVESVGIDLTFAMLEKSVWGYGNEKPRQ